MPAGQRSKPGASAGIGAWGTDKEVTSPKCM